jgi:hypothetical protein
VAAAADDPDTNPRAAPPRREAERETNPRVALPVRRPSDTDESTGPGAGRLPADTDETSAPDLRPASAPRPLGAEGDHSPTRPSGPRALSRSDLEIAPPRANPPPPPPSDSDLAPKTSLADLPDDTNPRAPSPLPRDSSPRTRPSRAHRVDHEPEDTGPRPQLPPPPRNTTEAERHRARGQERLRTPPQGVELGGGEDEEERHEPTAVRPRIDPEIETAETAQRLSAVPASSGMGLRVVMVVLLMVVVGIAGAVVLKLKRQSELPIAPVEEPAAEVDAGSQPVVDAGAPSLDAGLALVAPPAVDAGEEEEEEADAGAAEVAGSPPSVDAGHRDAGSAKKAVKKVVKKKKKGKH